MLKPGIGLCELVNSPPVSKLKKKSLLGEDGHRPSCDNRRDDTDRKKQRGIQTARNFEVWILQLKNKIEAKRKTRDRYRRRKRNCEDDDRCDRHEQHNIQMPFVEFSSCARCPPMQWIGG